MPCLSFCALPALSLLLATVPPPPGRDSDAALKISSASAKVAPVYDSETSAWYKIAPCKDPLGNALGLWTSPDGTNWTLKTVALRHEDRRFRFVPVGWTIDRTKWGNFVFACRTTWTGPGEKGEWITYHQLARFREMDRTSDALAYRVYAPEPEKWIGWKACSFNIDTAFPGGYANIDSMRGNTVTFNANPEEPLSSQMATHMRLRNFVNWSGSYHFAFRVSNAEGRKLHFEVTRGQPLGWLGPCLSRDGGRTWKYLYQKAAQKNMFSGFDVEFGPEDHEVIIAGRPLYTDVHLERFLSSVDPKAKRIERGVFATSPHGRPARYLRIGSPKARYACILSARHHTPEVEASFLLEGVMQELVAARSDEAKYLADNVEFFIVPFMSTDGVEEGSDNVRCRPHNYNRDYLKERYPEIRAFKRKVVEWTHGRPFIFDDNHTLGSAGSFIIPVVQETKAAFLEKSAPLLQQLHELQKTAGGIPVELGRITAEYKSWDMKDIRECSWGWMASRPNCLFSLSIECPSAIAIGWEDEKGRRVDWWKYPDQVGENAVEMNPRNIRVLGQNFAKSIARFYRERDK